MKRARKIDSRALSGTIGITTLRRMITRLVRAMAAPGISASMQLKLVRQINDLRNEIAKAKLEAARRKADDLLSDTQSDQPSR